MSKSRMDKRSVSCSDEINVNKSMWKKFILHNLGHIYEDFWTFFQSSKEKKLSVFEIHAQVTLSAGDMFANHYRVSNLSIR